jgi:hypothetical protein
MSGHALKSKNLLATVIVAVSSQKKIVQWAALLLSRRIQRQNAKESDARADITVHETIHTVLSHQTFTCHYKVIAKYVSKAIKGETGTNKIK